jgi:UDP-N-acetylglucosamine 2-epimerase (non-hydrolysing)
MPPARVHLIAAARPNFMKVAPLWHKLVEAQDFDPVLIHTGQHYDPNMSDQIFADLRLRQPCRTDGRRDDRL